MTKLLGLLFAFWFVLITLSASALGSSPEESVIPKSSILGAGTRMIVSLLLVLSMIVASVFLLKKITPYKGLASHAGSPLMILSRIPLGQKRYICLVRIADEILIVGMTNTSISLLSKMKADDYYGDNGKDICEIPESGHIKSFRKLYSTLIHNIGLKDRGGA